MLYVICVYGYQHIYIYMYVCLFLVCVRVCVYIIFFDISVFWFYIIFHYTRCLLARTPNYIITITITVITITIVCISAQCVYIYGTLCTLYTMYIYIICKHHIICVLCICLYTHSTFYIHTGSMRCTYLYYIPHYLLF